MHFFIFYNKYFSTLFQINDFSVKIPTGVQIGEETGAETGVETCAETCVEWSIHSTPCKEGLLTVISDKRLVVLSEKQLNVTYLVPEYVVSIARGRSPVVIISQ